MNHKTIHLSLFYLYGSDKLFGTWDPVSDAKEYEIEYAKILSASFNKLMATNETWFEFSLNEMEKFQDSQIRVAAKTDKLVIYSPPIVISPLIPTFVQVNPQSVTTNTFLHNHEKDLTRVNPIISFCSYNFLAQSLGTHRYFPYCQERYLRSRFRTPQLIEHVKSLCPSILAVQELDRTVGFETLLSKLGYDCFIAYNDPKVYGTVIFWKSSQFTKISSLEVLFDSSPDCLIPEEKPFTHNRAAIVSLSLNGTNHIITACSAHLTWRHMYHDVQIAQFRLALENARMMKAQCLKQFPKAHVHIFFGSDTNSRPDSRLINTIFPMTKLGVLYEFMMKLDPESNQRKNTNFTQNFKDWIDHILFDTEYANLLRFIQLPSEKELSSEIAIPSSVWPSDHLPLMGVFELK